MSKIQPVGDKILVLPIEKKEEKMESGLIEAATANAELSRGKVVAVSDELQNIYSEGDMVLHPSRCGIGQYMNGAQHLWLRNDEVWGIEKDEA
jgi:co-chaperonin GroES (HSP10)